MIRFGDVFSISTSKGDAYFQYVSKNPQMGWMIRVLPGIYSECPEDMSALVDKETNFWIFFPVAAALRRKLTAKIGRFKIPEHSQKMPIFRAGIRHSVTKKVENWWLWDGEREWMVGEITEDQRKLPIRGIWNDTLLIKRIEDGWLPEHDTA
ncbi:hypothetical protein [Pandoraea sputorum]|uniref:Uncharacterized protein n=1 Tax=Pandoraea sputorum TaxID=93222 RepID=A0A239SW61_9BURK|nr:hypothetical protein [Pandoraea sputorum]AJC15122.1 hypothetical protein NA29_01995 [Pandoraea sputorum]SNU89472.1 Uncharacterised protein [Pandoraea sputorum]VVE19526.1 hypothetical protein PSP20601_03072 [Pandoraea sputorum]